MSGRNLFATPIGVEFTSALIAGLDARLAGQPPEAIARVEIWVNSARMERNLRAQYLRKEAAFLPRIRPFEAMAHLHVFAHLPTLFLSCWIITAWRL